eukprot:173696-Pyramimonas_sp.AAC.1
MCIRDRSIHRSGTAEPAVLFLRMRMWRRMWRRRKDTREEDDDGGGRWRRSNSRRMTEKNGATTKTVVWRTRMRRTETAGTDNDDMFGAFRSPTAST